MISTNFVLVFSQITPAHIARNLESIFTFFPKVNDDAHLFQTPSLTRDSYKLREALNGTNTLYHLITAKCQANNNSRDEPH